MFRPSGKSIATAAVLYGALFTSSAIAAETYYTDQGHTEVQFSWDHAGVSRQSAEFTKAKGVLKLDPDKVENSELTVTVDAASVSTGYDVFDQHLRSDKWLGVEKNPEITFKSTKVTRTGDKTADVTGDLTMNGVTKPITFKTTLTHRGEHPVGKVLDYYKGQWVAFAATAEVDHMAFNIGSFSTGPISIRISTEMKDREN